MLLWARVDQLCLSCHSKTGGPPTAGGQPPSFHDLTLAALPQLHDLPRRGARVEPLADASEVGAHARVCDLRRRFARRWPRPRAQTGAAAAESRRRDRRSSIPVEFELGYRFVDVSRQRRHVPDADQRPAGVPPADADLGLDRPLDGALRLRPHRRLRRRGGARRDRCACRPARSTRSGSTSPGGGRTSTARCRPSPIRSSTTGSSRASTPTTAPATSTTRRSQIFPGKTLTPILGFTRNVYRGPGTTTYHVGENEFAPERGRAARSTRSTGSGSRFDSELVRRAP